MVLVGNAPRRGLQDEAGVSLQGLRKIPPDGDQIALLRDVCETNQRLPPVSPHVGGSLLVRLTRQAGDE